MLLTLVSDQPCEIDFQFMFIKTKSHWDFYVFVCIKILTLVLTHFLLYWSFTISALRVYFGFCFDFLFSPLSLSLGCGTYLSDKMITWMMPQEITLSPGSPESHPFEWARDNGVFIPLESCWNFHVGLMNLLQNLAVTFPDWWFPSITSRLTFFFYFIIDYYFQSCVFRLSYSALEIFQG
jgi:hypothetical protein